MSLEQRWSLGYECLFYLPLILVLAMFPMEMQPVLFMGGSCHCALQSDFTAISALVLGFHELEHRDPILFINLT